MAPVYQAVRIAAFSEGFDRSLLISCKNCVGQPFVHKKAPPI